MPPVVLVADDQPEDVLLLSRAFLTAGLPHQIIHVRNGHDAISYLTGEEQYVDRFRYPLPRLLVLDLTLGRENGLDLLEWVELQPTLATVPVIVISGSENPSDRQRALALGADSYRIKPAGLPGWVTIVKDIAARWLGAHPEPRRREATQTILADASQDGADAVTKGG
jgi:CheY-like chemotaxis protein